MSRKNLFLLKLVSTRYFLPPLCGRSGPLPVVSLYNHCYCISAQSIAAGFVFGDEAISTGNSSNALKNALLKLLTFEKPSALAASFTECFFDKSIALALFIRCFWKYWLIGNPKASLNNIFNLEELIAATL